MCGEFLRPIDPSGLSVTNVGHIVDMAFDGSAQLDFGIGKNF